MRTRPRKVLVVVASRHGATTGIAYAIGAELAERGLAVSVQPAEAVGGVDGYLACVIGSAVYAGRWQPAAKALVERNLTALRDRPVWLFSSGPVGDPLKPAADPFDAAPMVAATRAREHRVFAGRLDRARLGFLEKRVAQAVKAEYGDFRDWDAIRDWAASIAETLRREFPEAQQSLPEQSIPEQSLPEQSLPEQSLPEQSLPEQRPAGTRAGVRARMRAGQAPGG